jgi:hypothetical protein
VYKGVYELRRIDTGNVVLTTTTRTYQRPYVITDLISDVTYLEIFKVGSSKESNTELWEIRNDSPQLLRTFTNTTLLLDQNYRWLVEWMNNGPAYLVDLNYLSALRDRANDPAFQFSDLEDLACEYLFPPGQYDESSLKKTLAALNVDEPQTCK